MRSAARILTIAGVDPTGETLKDQTWAIPFTTFMTTRMTPPEWLVDCIWQAGTYGMLAGEPKTFKSTLSTDLALSVAGGHPFLGMFSVPKAGAVLYIQEENSPQTIQDRVIKIAQSKGLTETRPEGIGLAKNLPLYFSNNYGIDLTHRESRITLEKTIKDIMPVLVIFDPLYMMLGSANENDATEMRNTLHWLSMLRNKYGTAILILHHYNKSSGGALRGGQKIRGTSEFHAWVESALYVKTTSTPGSIKVEREFRSYPILNQLAFTVEIGEPGYAYYYPTVNLQEITSAQANEEFKKSEEHTFEKIMAVLVHSPKTLEEIQAACKLSRGETQRILSVLKDAQTIRISVGGGRGRQTLYYLNLKTEKSQTAAIAEGDADGTFVQF